MPSSIPIIDLANISTSHAALKEAVETIGFFYIQNTLISNQEVEEMFAVSKDFYENESVEEKRLCAHNIDNKGYGHEEVLDSDDPAGDCKETFNVQCLLVCDQLLQAFSVALGIDPNYLSSMHDPNGGPSAILRFLHYPATPVGIKASPNRAGAHSDYGSLTLLFQSPTPSILASPASMAAGTGLQVLPASSTLSSNNWVSVPFIPNAILVNVGDLLEFWSAARFRSTLHRVRNGAPMEGEEEDSKKRVAVDERYSMAFFCHPRPDTDVKALVERSSGVSDIDVERMERKGVKLGVKLTAHQHLMARLGATGQ